MPSTPEDEIVVPTILMPTPEMIGDERFTTPLVFVTTIVLFVLVMSTMPELEMVVPLIAIPVPADTAIGDIHAAPTPEVAVSTYPTCGVEEETSIDPDDVFKYVEVNTEFVPRRVSDAFGRAKTLSPDTR